LYFPFFSPSQDSISLQLLSGHESAHGAFKVAIKKSLNVGNVAPRNISHQIIARLHNENSSRGTDFMIFYL